MTMMKGKKKAGRPRAVQDGRVRSYLLGRQERRVLAEHQRKALQTSDNVSEGHVVRLLIRSSNPDQAIRDDAEKQELRRRLDHEAEQRARLEAALAQATKNGRQKEGAMSRLLLLLPLVRERAANGPNIASGNRLLDQVWFNTGESWPRVLARLELLQRDSPASAPTGGGI